LIGLGERKTIVISVIDFEFIVIRFIWMTQKMAGIRVAVCKIRVCHLGFIRVKGKYPVCKQIVALNEECAFDLDIFGESKSSSGWINTGVFTYNGIISPHLNWILLWAFVFT
jgi:hypothetical protein